MVGFVARRPVIVIECDAFSQKPIKIASTRGGEANFSSSSGFKSSASLGPRDYREKRPGPCLLSEDSQLKPRSGSTTNVTVETTEVSQVLEET
jgi:hypothetical protein